MFNYQSRRVKPTTQQGFLTCHGAQLFYEMSGTGDTVVFLHGAPLDSRMWEPQFAALRDKHQILRFDMRGMGQSVDPGGPFTLYEDLHALLQQLNVQHATLVGASFGCYAGVEFALARPEMVNRLILLCPGGFAPPSADRRQRLQKLQEQFEQGNLEEALEMNLHELLQATDRAMPR